MAYFNKKIAANPQDADALRARGRLWYAQKEYEKATADFHKALNLQTELSSKLPAQPGSAVRDTWFGTNAARLDKAFPPIPAKTVPDYFLRQE